MQRLLDLLLSAVFCADKTGNNSIKIVQIVLQVLRRSDARPLLHRLHWLTVKHRILYKTAVVIFKVPQTSTPTYLSRLIKPRDCARHLRSSDTSILAQSTNKTHFAGHGFRLSAPAVRNSHSFQVHTQNLSLSHGLQQHQFVTSA